MEKKELNKIAVIFIQRVIIAETKARKYGLKLKVHMTEEVIKYFDTSWSLVKQTGGSLTFRGYEVVTDTVNGIELWEEIK